MRAIRQDKESHGMAGTKIYRIWADMLARCRRPSHPRYSSYGGRGISVDSEWLVFSGFYRDMGDRPEGRSLDRKNNDEGYSKDNCRWATAVQQASNKRNSTPIEACGITMSRSGWASLFSRDHSWLRDKLKRGNNLEDMLISLGGSAGLEYLCQA